MKNLRKITAVLLIIIMATFALAGCGASGNDEIVGTWNCTSLDVGNGNVLDQLGSSYSDTIKFYATKDGDCLFDMAGQQIPMHWKWIDENNDYKLTITLADFAESNGMTEEQMKDALQGSGSTDIETEQNYKGEMKDGKLVVDMAAFYDQQNENSAELSYKMEFTFSNTGDAPASLDDVKNTAR